MTFSETFAEYWPSMLIGLKETGIMMSISMAICLIHGRWIKSTPDPSFLVQSLTALHYVCSLNS